MSWRAQNGNVSRKRQTFGDSSALDHPTIAVEIVSAELAQDGGPAPNVRCTISQRSSGAGSPRVVGTSVCQQSWNPVWKETLRLQVHPGSQSTRVLDLVLWDETDGESSCLGELVIPLEDLQFFLQVQSKPLMQGTDADARQVGTVFIRAQQVEDSSAERPANRFTPREPQMDAASRRSGDHSRTSFDYSSASRSPRRATFVDVPEEQPAGRTKSSPIAELGFFENAAQTAGGNSRAQSPSFRVLQADGKGTQLFDTPSARVFSPPIRNRSASPIRTRSFVELSDSPPSQRAPSSRLERASNAARSTPAGMRGTMSRAASVLLERASQNGTYVVGEQVGVGIGLQVAPNGDFFISSVGDGTPAADAVRKHMISVGDVVEAIDGVRVHGKSVERVISMMKGPIDTPVRLDLQRKESPPPRPDDGRKSMLLVRLRESFHKLTPQEASFSEILLHDLHMCSNSDPERFKYMGMEDHHHEIEASIEVRGELPRIDERSSNDICDLIVAQCSNASSKLRQSPSMENFRSIQHYLKTSKDLPPTTRPYTYVAPVSVSKLEAAMEAIKTSKVLGNLSPSKRTNHDPLSQFDQDVEISIGNPALSLRDKITSALQIPGGGENEALPAVKSGRDLHVSIREGIDATHVSIREEDNMQILKSPGSPGDGLADKTIYGTKFDLRHVYFRFMALIATIIAMALLLGSRVNPIPWHWLGWCTILFSGIAPWAQHFQQFFSGGGESPIQWLTDLIFWQKRVYKGGLAFWWLALSTFVSALLGDSLWEGAATGYRYGSTGGFAHAIYYVGIAFMYGMIYRMRTIHPYAQNMMQLINVCFGWEACGIFGCLVLYRTLNLVWTGALTTGLLFQEYDASMGVFWGGIICGVAPLFYTLMGGMRSLYPVHPLQAFLLWCFITAVLCEIPPGPNFIQGNGSWTLIGGGDLIIVRLLQGSMSLPWITSVLTDRAFLSTPGISFAAVLTGTLLAYCWSWMASLFGIYARFAEIDGTLIDMGKSLGEPFYHLIVLMTIINSMAIIDSCFVSVAKLGGLEAYGMMANSKSLMETRHVLTTKTELVTSTMAQQLRLRHPLDVRSPRISRSNVLVGRIFKMIVGVVGICCLASEAARPRSLLSARLSGIMTMGIGPSMILLCVWKRDWKQSPTAFWMPVAVSLIIGILCSIATTCDTWAWGQCTKRSTTFASNWKLGEGDYAFELGLTVFSFLIAVLACIIGFLLDQQFRLPDSTNEPNRVRRYAEKVLEEEMDHD